MSAVASGPSYSHNRTALNVETASADSRQVLLPSQGQSIFILNPIVIPSSSHNNMSNNTVIGTPNNGLLPLHSLPLQITNSNHSMGNVNNANGNAPQLSATQNGNHYASFPNAYSSPMHLSSQEFLPPTTRKEEPVDLDETEIPLSFMQAYNFVGMVQNSLQHGVVQVHMLQKEHKKEKAEMNMEIVRLSNKCSQLENDRNDLENLLAEERKECFKKQEDLNDYKEKLDEMREKAKQQESHLQKERADGNAKAVKIEELQKNISEITKKSEETDKELQEVKDINRKVVDEYFESITKPTTINKLLSEQLAKNPIESSSTQFQMSTFLATNILEHYQSQEKNLGTSTGTKGTVASKSKKRKHGNDSFDTDKQRSRKD